MGFKASILVGRFQSQKWHKKWHNWHSRFFRLAIMAAQFSGRGLAVVASGGVSPGMITGRFGARLRPAGRSCRLDAVRQWSSLLRE